MIINNKFFTYIAQILSAYDQMRITYKMWLPADSAVIIKAEQVVYLLILFLS